MNAPLHVIRADWSDPATFDEYDIDSFSTLPPAVAKAVSALLQSRREMMAYKNVTLEDLIPELDRLYTSCLEEWRDL